MKQRARTTEENIRMTIDFMRANLSRAISLRELASLAHLSVSRYEAAFTKSVGCSSIKYLHRMKIQPAVC
jgi:transcriptional regulator GlxA family with amidase domain